MRRDQIVSGSISDLIPIGLDGRPVYTNASSFLDALTYGNKSETDFSRNLAVPQMSLDGSHMDWYVPFEPSVEKGSHDIVSWYAADQQMRDSAIQFFSRMESGLTLAGRAMARQSSQSSASTIGRYLENNKNRCLPALHFPGPECIYFVDGTPVITFWGFTRNMKSLSQSPFACLSAPEASIRPVKKEETTPVFKPTADSIISTSASSGAHVAGTESDRTSADGADRIPAPSDRGTEVSAAGGAGAGSGAAGSSGASGASGVSRALLILAAAVFLLTVVLLLKFLGVFDSLEAQSASAPAAVENQIYINPDYHDESEPAAYTEQTHTDAAADADAAAAAEPAEAADADAAAAAEPAEAADADAAAAAEPAAAEEPADNSGQENGIYLSEDYLNSQQ